MKHLITRLSIDFFGKSFFSSLRGLLSRSNLNSVKRLLHSVRNDAFIFRRTLMLFLCIAGTMLYAQNEKPFLAIASIGKTDSVFKYGFIDQKGNWVIQQQYDFYPSYAYTEIKYGFSEGYANVCQDKVWYFIDRKGNILSTVKGMDFVSILSCGLALANTGGFWDDRNFINGGKWQYVDWNGNIILSPEMRAASDFHDGLACIGISMVDPGDGYIDKQGKIKLTYNNGDFGRDFLNDTALMETSDHRAILIDTGGRIVAGIGYFNSCYNYSNGILSATNGDSVEFVNKLGVQVFKNYISAMPYNKTMTGVEVGKKWGFIDSKGELYIPPVYEAVGNYSNGLVSVRKNGKWGFIDNEGKLVIPFKFDFVEEFH